MAGHEHDHQSHQISHQTHGDSHSHGHSHVHSSSSGRTLMFALVFTVTFAVVEVLAGLMADSLALLSDAAHMFTDSLSLGVGAFAAWLASKPASRRHSFGLQRAEVLGALFNVIFMFLVVAFIVYEAIMRLNAPPEVNGLVVMVIGGLGLLVNAIVAWVLVRGEQNINVRGAFLHVLGDLLGSVAALAAGATIYLGGPFIIDPILSLVVSLLILVSAVRLLREIAHVLMEGVPAGIDAMKVNEALIQTPGVRAVHDMHIWSLTTSSHALSAHVELTSMQSWSDTLPQLRSILRDRFDITHSTLQPEDAGMRISCDADPNCGSGQPGS